MSYAAHAMGLKMRGLAAKGGENIAAWDKFTPMDTPAVGAKLRGMLAQGTFTPKQALEKMAAMSVNDTSMSKPDGELEMGMKLRELVAMGQITRGQARAKMEAWKKLGDEAKLVAWNGD